MKSYFYLFILLSIPQLPAVHQQNQTDLPPLAYILYPTLNDMEAYALGEGEGYAIIFGGIIRSEYSGHYPEGFANTEIIIIDYEERRATAYTSGAFEGVLGEQLASRGMAYFQKDSTLYLLGGYGYSETHQRFLTFPYLINVDLPALAEALQRGIAPQQGIFQWCDDRLAIFDGTLDYNEGEFFLLNGREAQKLHPFEDKPVYSETSKKGEVRTFRLNGEDADQQISQFRTWYDLDALEQYYQGSLPPKIAAAIEEMRLEQLED